ncbi:hypothetical protein NQ314_007768 [Rhamnusium bicolor]|uniref:Uncharacterized protein n=1 Tax=Rhamnusium bicolor TaxID=1586634 RepID=A0AAV8YJZ6_9CUCU|nr:hypothetical protein NQ314_007768 [Rhamnusium bicolor]
MVSCSLSKVNTLLIYSFTAFTMNCKMENQTMVSRTTRSDSHHVQKKLVNSDCDHFLYERNYNTIIN